MHIVVCIWFLMAQQLVLFSVVYVQIKTTLRQFWCKLPSAMS